MKTYIGPRKVNRNSIQDLCKKCQNDCKDSEYGLGDILIKCEKFNPQSLWRVS